VSEEVGREREPKRDGEKLKRERENNDNNEIEDREREGRVIETEKDIRRGE
jgi:hypothetical protein